MLQVVYNSVTGTQSFYLFPFLSITFPPPISSLPSIPLSLKQSCICNRHVIIYLPSPGLFHSSWFFLVHQFIGKIHDFIFSLGHIVFRSWMFHSLYIHSSFGGHSAFPHILAIVNRMAMNITVHMVFLSSTLEATGYIPRKGTAGSGSNRSSIFSLKYVQIVFRNGCTREQIIFYLINEIRAEVNNS